MAIMAERKAVEEITSAMLLEGRNKIAVKMSFREQKEKNKC